jgi:hypothetical protein
VTVRSKLDLTKVTGIDFTPGVDASTTGTKTGTFSVTECVLHGVAFTGVSNQWRAQLNQSASAYYARGNLRITGLSGPCGVAVFDITGRRIAAMTNVSPGTDGTVSLPVACASQALLVKVEKRGETLHFRVPGGN